MPTVRGCAFPDHLRYDVLNHLWYEPLGDGTARIGMTVVAVALAGEVLAFTPSGSGAVRRRPLVRDHRERQVGRRDPGHAAHCPAADRTGGTSSSPG